MQLTQKLFFSLKSRNVLDSERLLWMALRLEETDADGFFLFKQEDWSAKYNLPISTLKKYLKNLEEKHLIRRDYRSLTSDAPYEINRAAGNYLFIKVLLPETEEDMSFFGKLHLIESKTFPSKEVCKL